MRTHSTENQKKWFDKKYKEGYSREEMLAVYRDRVALCKTMKRKPKIKEIVINNGKVAKRFNADLPIPEGWERGKLKRGATNE